MLSPNSRSVFTFVIITTLVAGATAITHETKPLRYTFCEFSVFCLIDLIVVEN